MVGANAECRSPTPALEVAAENSVTPASTALPLRKDVVTSSSARHWTRRSRMRSLRALAPGAVELSVAATEEVLRERAGIERHWQQRLERARLSAERIERQYQLVEPENRLVARTLEQRWNEALLAHRQLEEEYRRFQQAQPKVPTATELQQLRTLAANLPAAWPRSDDAPERPSADHPDRGAGGAGDNRGHQRSVDPAHHVGRGPRHRASGPSARQALRAVDRLPSTGGAVARVAGGEPIE